MNVENASGGTLDVASGLLQQDFATTTTNDAGGTVQTDAAVGPGKAGMFELTAAGASVVNSGSVVNNGTFSLAGGASWTQSGGALSGSNPVSIAGGSLIDSVGTGQFVLTASVNLSGTIPSGQTVTVSGGGIDSRALLSGNVANYGELVLDNGSSTGFADVQASSGTPTLTNYGTVKSSVEGIGQNYLEVNVENASGGTLDVASGLLQQDFATTTTNDGTVTLGAGASYDLTSGGFTGNSDGTMYFDIASATRFGAVETSSPAAFQLDGGTAAGVLQSGYTPPLEQQFKVLTGPYTGTFTTVSSGFAGDYTANAVSLVYAPSQAISFTSTVPASPTVGGGYTVTATGGGSGNAVTFSVDSSSAVGACSISGAAVSFTGVGSCVIDANQAGNANYTAAPQAQQALTIAKASQAISFTSTVPANTVPPAISGPAQQGQSLAASQGSWTNSPSGFAYQWLRCDSLGGNCSPITGATSSDYTPSAADAGSTLRVTVTATNAANSVAATSAPTALVSGLEASLAAPVLGVSTDLSPVNGTVLIRLPGSSSFTPLSAAIDVPLGSTIDATSGRVSLTVALPDGASETGQFYDGEFVVTQSANGTLIATLTGGSFAGCPAPPTSGGNKGAALIAASKKKSTTVVRQLWGNAHGNYTTKGRYGSAAVSGTIWLRSCLNTCVGWRGGADVGADSGGSSWRRRDRLRPVAGAGLHCWSVAFVRGVRGGDRCGVRAVGSVASAQL